MNRGKTKERQKAQTTDGIQNTEDSLQNTEYRIQYTVYRRQDRRDARLKGGRKHRQRTDTEHRGQKAQTTDEYRIQYTGDRKQATDRIQNTEGSLQKEGRKHRTRNLKHGTANHKNYYNNRGEAANY